MAGRINAMASPSFIQTTTKENRWFFLGFAAYLIIGGILLLLLQQGDPIFFFSENRTAFGDFFFRYGTILGEEEAYFAALGLLLFVRYRYALALPFIGFTVTALSFGLKKLFAHPRPLAYFEDLGLLDQIQMVEGVVVHGGPSSFPSGHTMGGFTLMTFLALCLPKKKGIGVLLISIAIIVGISRIYLVQHFLKDIYLGAIIGVGLGMLWYFLTQKYPPIPHRWLDGSLMDLFRRKTKSEQQA
jgi:membrane-associated phospholipid phosphatase